MVNHGHVTPIYQLHHTNALEWLIIEMIDRSTVWWNEDGLNILRWQMRSWVIDDEGRMTNE
jgi:hypothetical protein